MVLENLRDLLTTVMGDPTTLLDDLIARRTDPYTEAKRLMESIVRGQG